MKWSQRKLYFPDLNRNLSHLLAHRVPSVSWLDFLLQHPYVLPYFKPPPLHAFLCLICVALPFQMQNMIMWSKLHFCDWSKIVLDQDFLHFGLLLSPLFIYPVIVFMVFIYHCSGKTWTLMLVVHDSWVWSASWGMCSFSSPVLKCRMRNP